MACFLKTTYSKVLKEIDPKALSFSYLHRQVVEGSVDILSVGKAAVPMALAAVEVLGSRIRRGFLLTKDHHIDDASRKILKCFLLREAAHPVPDQSGLKATEELVDWLSKSDGKSLLVFMSGGSSSLLVAPRPPLSLNDLQAVNAALLGSGLPIEQMNVLRKHLSAVKGGQLANACQSYSSLEQLVMVDICAPQLSTQEVLSLVGSGCFVGDPSDVAEAQSLLDELDLSSDLAKRCREALVETPREVACKSTIVGSHRTVLEVARKNLGQELLECERWNHEVVGEVNDVLADFLETARRLQDEGKRGVLVACGEPTVKLRGKPGRGGRCQELALRFAQAVAGNHGLKLLAGSTDGTDGPTDDAGAVVDGASWPTLCEKIGSLRAEQMLAEHDSGTGLAQLEGALLHTGPTGGNLNDLYLLQIL